MTVTTDPTAIKTITEDNTTTIRVFTTEPLTGGETPSNK